MSCSIRQLSISDSASFNAGNKAVARTKAFCPKFLPGQYVVADLGGFATRKFFIFCILGRHVVRRTKTSKASNGQFNVRNTDFMCGVNV